MADEATWFKSSYSNDTGGSCVEIADLTPRTQVGIRDSKHKTGPALLVSRTTWHAFLTGVVSGDLDQGLVG